MEDKKPWYKSKGVLGGLAAFLTGAYQLFSQTIGPAFGLELPVIPDGAFSVLEALFGGIALKGRLSAKKKIG